MIHFLTPLMQSVSGAMGLHHDVVPQFINVRNIKPVTNSIHNSKFWTLFIVIYDSNQIWILQDFLNEGRLEHGHVC